MEERKVLVRNMLERGMSVEAVRACTGLSRKEIDT